MPETLFSQGGSAKQRRGLPVAFSLGLHLTAFALLMSAPEVKLPPPAKSEYKQVIEGKEDKIVWYKFKNDLPDITPLAKPALRPLKALQKAKQQIVASPRRAPARQQIVVAPAPELPDTKPIESPNLVALRVERPAAKPFFAPPVAPQPEITQVQPLADAPAIDAKATNPVVLPGANTRITRPFVPPPAQIQAKLPEVVPLNDAPKLTASLSNTPAELPFALKTPGRPFTPRAAHPPSSPGRVTVDAAPSIAIVGVKPVELATALPTSSSPAQFSAAPQIRREGATTSGDERGITVPDLFVRGARDAKPDLVAEAFAAPTSARTLRQALRSGAPRVVDEGTSAEPEKGASPPGAVKVSGAPDPRFNGRDVYMMAIQMPNLTSFSGSWLMWYSDRTMHSAGLAPISPPIAHRKVDPKYIASAVSDKVQGKVQLACIIGKDGLVSYVEVVRGLDDRLNQSAKEALAKWEFTPATRQGEPVEVDVLVEIPFRLEPHAPVSY